MQLYFLRHGQSTNNLLWAESHSNAGRSTDPALTPLGKQQAGLLGQFLSRGQPALDVDGRDPQNLEGFGITHIYSSLMLRAVETGTIVARALGLPLHAWEDIHEEGGIYLEDENGAPIGQPGSTRQFYQENFPDLVLPEKFSEDGWWNRPYETPEMRPERAQRFVRDLLERHGGTQNHVAIVSHGGFYNQLMAALLHLPAGRNTWFSINNCAITHIDLDPDWVNVAYMNRVDFLTDEMIT